MFQFLGYDFFSGPDALNPAPAEARNLKATTLSNAIFDHFNVTNDVKEYGDTALPEGWTFDTVLNANFNGNTDAGNLDYVVGQISGIEIKRREKGTFDWITLKYIPIDGVDDLSFTFNDFLNAYGVEYDYALVPIAEGTEGEYIIDSIMSKFSGVFIGDAEQSFKFLYDVSYSSNARNQQVGVFQPLGKQYPIIVANGDLDYESGTVNGTILNDDFHQTGLVDNVDIVKKKDRIKDFLVNKKPKILKDSNGNLWIVMIVDNVPMNYKQGSFMSIPQVSFNWVQVADKDNQESLYEAGLTNVPE